MQSPLQWLRNMTQFRGRPAPDDDYWYRSVEKSLTSSGTRVTPETAAKCVVVYGCARILSRDRPSLPCFLYQKTDTGRRRATEKPAYHIVHEQPNRFMSTMEWGRAVEWSMAFRGNQYNYIDWSDSGGLRGIYPLPTDKTDPEIVNGEIYYDVTVGGVKRRYPERKILHFRDVTEDGILGLSPVTQAANSIGLRIDADQYASDFFENDATPGGYFEHPGKLGPNEHENLRKSHEANHRGGGKHHVIGILEEGMKWNQVQITPEDVQCLATRAFQKEELAGAVFGIPLQKLGSTQDTSYNNTENFRLEYVTDCVRPMCVAREQRMNLSLLTPEERTEGYYFEHSVEALLRGDMNSQANYFKALFYIGALKPNEVRAYLNKPMEDGGDTLFVPENMRPIDEPYQRGSNVKSEDTSDEKDSQQ